MKILAIRIHNLASITDAVIDFTQAPLKQAGLFAITGDTGAGKSTLLDAICLALYAKTARLRGDKGHLVDFNGDNIKLNDPRNLLRRGTAKGYAEVDFLSQDKHHYRARFSVNRARGKIDGNLKAAEHSLIRLTDETNLTDTKVKTLNEIERLIGLSFEQFSRAVLLAQHEFAAFLKATSDERAQLLECLTGTDKFSQIGQRIFERHNEKRDELARLADSLNDYELLTDEQLASKKAEQTALKQQQNELNQQLKQTEQLLEWYRTGKQLAQQHSNAEQRISEQQTYLAEHADNALQAKQAQQCSEIKDNRERSAAIDKLLTQLNEQHAQLRAVDHQANISQASKQLDNEQTKLEQVKQQQQDAAPEIKQARELDQQLAIFTEQQQATEQQWQKQQTTLSELNSQHAELSKTITQHLQQSQQLEQWLTQQQQWQQLAEQWLFYKSELERSQQLQSQLKESDQQQQKTQQEQQKLQAQLSEENNQVQQLESKQKSQIAQLEALQSSTKNLDLNTLVEQLDAINYLKDQRIKWQKNNEQLKLWQSQKQQTADQLTQLQQQLTELKKQLSEAELKRDHQQTSLQQVQLRASENVSQLRSALVDNEPCAVCGSKEHPFKQQQADTAWHDLVEEFRQHYDNAKQQHLHLQQQTHKVENSLAVTDQNLTNLNTQIAELQQVQADIDTTMQASRGELNELSEQALAAHQTKLTQQKNSYLNAQAEINTLQLAINTCQAELKQHTSQLQDLQQSEARLTQQQQHLANKQQDLTAQQHNINQHLNQTFHDCDWWQQWQAGKLTLADAHTQTTQYLTKQQQLTEAQQAKKDHEHTLNHIEPELKKVQQNAEQIKANRSDLSTQISKNKQQRQGLCNALSVDEYVKSLSEAVEQQQTNLVNAQRELDKQIKAKDEQQLKLHNLAQQKDALTQELQVITTRFEAWFAEFKAEHPEVTAASINQLLSISRDEVKQHLATQQQLEDALKDAQADLKQVALSQQKHQQQMQPDATEAVANDSLKQLHDQREQITATLIGISAELTNHQQNSAKLADKQQQLTQLQTQYNHWHLLNKVLGDKEGKKMRNLAQTQTLKILLHYANSHLKTLNKRYWLTNIGQTLDIAIIDKDMADEQRSVNTLSGGESFLVSLALALGLASLSSNKVQINSLFIDEGFGTLDSDTLSIAMDALDSLQAQGRKVGVISHVAEMTERVATQVHVAKKPGGYSQVSIL